MPHEIEHETPQQEAAFFYGLFLHGHPLEQLRRDLDVPHRVLRTWERMWRSEPHVRRRLHQMVSYRRQVLAIFNTLINLEIALSHLRQ
jgi:hypothetical protein